MKEKCTQREWTRETLGTRVRVLEKQARFAGLGQNRSRVRDQNRRGGSRHVDLRATVRRQVGC